MVNVSLYVEEGDEVKNGVYGFVFDEDEELRTAFPREHDRRGVLTAPNNVDRQLEGLTELLEYAQNQGVLDLCVRTRSPIIREAINHFNGIAFFNKDYYIYDDEKDWFACAVCLCDFFMDVQVKLISSNDKKLNEAEGLANALCVYTDGSCLDNGQPNARAGAAIYFGPNHRLNQQFQVEGKQTNNRAEYTAIIKALETAIAQRQNYVIIHTDCDLIIKTMGTYIQKWKNSGWRNARGESVEN